MNHQNEIDRKNIKLSTQIKEYMMNQRIVKLDFLIALLFLLAMILSACGTVPALADVISIPTVDENAEPDGPSPTVTRPEDARDAALNFVNLNFGNPAPGFGQIWVEGVSRSDTGAGMSLNQYLAGQWSVWVSYTAALPEQTIYTVLIQAEESGFRWEGLVDAYGQAATIVVFGSEQPMDPEVDDPGPPDPPVVGMLSYRDDLYKVALEYPADWSLSEVSAGAGSDARALRMQKGNWFLVIHYKLLWDDTVLGGGLPAGDVVERGWGALLGRSVPMNFVMYGGKDKVLFYGDRFEDLEFLVRLDAQVGSSLDYADVDLPDPIVAEAENIVASIIRTGKPIARPVPTQTPIPPTPTPAPVPCNAVSFQADLTIPDGTIFAPDADFVKTWRLKNIGTCSWDTDYDLVFVDGDRMNGAKAMALPEKIRPGERLDISIALTSPSKAGEYRGYWMLRSDDGEWFGYGDEADKPFWVEIDVVKTASNHAYDFALNLCAATWRSEGMRLPCPGYQTSQEGFAQVLDNPKLENRNENEVAIWVHPNEARGGWIEGTYPTLKIKDGDHFKAWVGCLKDYGKCSLKFYLDYKDEKGKVHHLGEWVEEYDGDVTVIDLDLSELAGEKVGLILGAEALTKNVDDAQGFWFVPHISSGN